MAADLRVERVVFHCFGTLHTAEWMRVVLIRFPNLPLHRVIATVFTIFSHTQPVFDVYVYACVSLRFPMLRITALIECCFSPPHVDRFG